jgi:CelD/BcsL family acetyltransferase involved in cellulose biosynthesis
MRIKTYNQLSDVLLSKWEELWQNSEFATVVNSPAWFLSSLKAFPTKEIRIIALHKSKKLIGIALFVKVKMYGFSVWQTPGAEFADRNSLLLDLNEDTIVYYFCEELKKLGNVNLTGLTSENIMLLQQKVKNAKFLQVDQDPYSYFEESIYGDFPKRHRTNVMNRLSHLEEPVEFITSRKNHNKALEIAYQIEIQSSKNEHGKSVFDRTDAKTFYSSFANLLPKNMAISLLYFGEKPVAYCIGFVCNNTFFASQKAHLSEYNYYNPGKVVMIKMLEYWNKKGIQEFSHGRGYDRFKMSFTKTARPIFTMTYSKYFFLPSLLNSLSIFQQKIYEIISRHQKMYAEYHNLKNSFTTKFNKNIIRI